MSLFTRAVVGVTERAVVEKSITETKAGKALARRFVAGDTLTEAAAASTGLNGEGLKVSLDLLGEEVADLAGAGRAVDEYVASLARLDQDGIDANISVKLTQLGLSIDQDVATDALDRLASEAGAAGTTVTVDMEDSRFTDATIETYEVVQRTHGNLGICLQAYLRRTPDDLARLIPLGGHIRLCKGAYVEPEAIAYRSSDDVDAAYARLLTMLMEAEVVRPAVATHDPSLIELARRLDAGRTSGFEFQMLYGVRPDEQRRLVADGYDVRVYVPFGSAWYPYLTRRLAERPANVWFFLRSFLGS